MFNDTPQGTNKNCNHSTDYHMKNRGICDSGKPCDCGAEKSLELKTLLNDQRTGLKESSDTNKTRMAILGMFAEQEEKIRSKTLREVREMIVAELDKVLTNFDTENRNAGELMDFIISFRRNLLTQSKEK